MVSHSVSTRSATQPCRMCTREGCFVFVHYLSTIYTLYMPTLCCGPVYIVRLVLSAPRVGTPVGNPPRTHTVPHLHTSGASMRCERAPKSRPVRCALLSQNITGHTEERWPHSHAHTHKLAVPAPQQPFRAQACFSAGWGCAQSLAGPLCIVFAVLSEPTMVWAL